MESRASIGPATIAELTGKEHKNVLADIRKMLDELGKAAADFSAVAQVPGPNGSNRQVEVYNLPKRETLILVSGYSVAMRAKIIDRWQELEAGVQPVLNLRDPVQIAQVGNFRGK
jgi:phage regulator Rha-like protein